MPNARGRIIYLLPFSYLLLDQTALAQITGPVTGGLTLQNPLTSNDIIQVINNVLNYLIYISVPFLALMILVGGFQILFARESPEKVASGRKTIQWAVIGFAIILISKGIALILLQILGG